MSYSFFITWVYTQGFLGSIILVGYLFGDDGILTYIFVGYLKNKKY